MSTPHNAAQKGDFASTVLMPGDPLLRAKFIAETFLEGAKLVTSVRGMLGYTGTYKGRPVSVMGSGMGMPSIGIYSWSCSPSMMWRTSSALALRAHTVKRQSCSTWCWPRRHIRNPAMPKHRTAMLPIPRSPASFLNAKLRASSTKRLSIPLIEGVIHSSDVFYRDAPAAPGQPLYWQALRDEKGCLAVEMESFALFHNARVTGRHAACLLTISDSFTSHEETTPEQRQTSFTQMMEVALGTVLE